MSLTAELREKRAGLVAEARKIVDAAYNDGKRSMTAEETEKWERIHGDVDSLKTQIDRLERQEASEGALQEVRKTGIGREDRQVEKAINTNRQDDAFRQFVRYGEKALSADQSAELRALSVGVAGSGGYSVPTSFADNVLKMLRDYSGVRRAPVTVLKTDSGNDLVVPALDDTSTVGEIVAEGSCTTQADPAFSNVALKSYNFSSKMVLVSIQLLQDSAIDIDTMLPALLAERISKAQNQFYTSGSGTAQPQGIVTAAAIGVTGAGGQLTAVKFSDLVALEASVPSVYRKQGTTGYMMSDKVLGSLKLTVDTTGRPIWQAGVAVGEPDKINGYPYWINPDMADPAANAKSVLFGDFSAYYIRDVRQIQLVRLVERFADCFQIGFLAFQRSDGRLLNANAVKAFRHAAA